MRPRAGGRALNVRRVAVIGTGVMGKPIAENLLRAGFDVAVHNRSARSLAALCDAGAIAPGSARAAGEFAEIAISMLPDLAAVHDVVLGTDGLLDGLAPGSIYVGMETLAPEASRAIARAAAQRGIAAIDAPASGGEPGAIAGTLAIMAGGDADAFERARPVLEAIGSNVTLVGPAGAGQTAKACNQLIVAATIEAVAEAFALARALDVDPARIREAIGGGFAASRVLEFHGKRMIDGDFTPGGRIAFIEKDRAIVLGAAQAAGLELPVAQAAFDRALTVIGRGGGDLDQSAVYTLFFHPASQPSIPSKGTP
jgi:2-hydroxy-3-oxopropionate reductase